MRLSPESSPDSRYLHCMYFFQWMLFLTPTREKTLTRLGLTFSIVPSRYSIPIFKHSSQNRGVNFVFCLLTHGDPLKSRCFEITFPPPPSFHPPAIPCTAFQIISLKTGLQNPTSGLKGYVGWRIPYVTTAWSAESVYEK